MVLRRLQRKPEAKVANEVTAIGTLSLGLHFSHIQLSLVLFYTDAKFLFSLFKTWVRWKIWSLNSDNKKR